MNFSLIILLVLSSPFSLFLIYHFFFQSLDGNIANSKSDHSSNDRKRRKNSKRRKRGRRSSKNNKLTRKLFRVRSIGPTNLVSDDAEDNHIVDQSEQTLIKQLKEDLFI